MLQIDVDLSFLQNDLLYKSSFTQLVVPQSLVDNVLFQIRDSNLAGHPGRDRSYSQ